MRVALLGPCFKTGRNACPIRPVCAEGSVVRQPFTVINPRRGWFPSTLGLEVSAKRLEAAPCGTALAYSTMPMRFGEWACRAARTTRHPRLRSGWWLDLHCCLVVVPPCQAQSVVKASAVPPKPRGGAKAECVGPVRLYTAVQRWRFDALLAHLVMCFSQVARATCVLSGFQRVFSLRRLLPPVFTLQRYSATPGYRERQCAGGKPHGGYSPISARKRAAGFRCSHGPPPGCTGQVLYPHPSSRAEVRPKAANPDQDGLIPLRSPLLGESLLVSFPALTKML